MTREALTVRVVRAKRAAALRYYFECNLAWKHAELRGDPQWVRLLSKSIQAGARESQMNPNPACHMVPGQFVLYNYPVT